MRQLREFAQRIDEFEKLGIRVVAISVDPPAKSGPVHVNIAMRKITLLSDPGAKVISSLGLLHKRGFDGKDIAIRATILIDADGRERWRRVSLSASDTPSIEEILGLVDVATRTKPSP